MRKNFPARWAAVVVLLAIAAVVWWQWRPSSGTLPPAETPVAKAPASIGPLLSVAPATSLRAVGTNVPVIPADPQFPHRLRNTEEPVEKLARSDRAILMANAFIDTGLKARLGIPEHLQTKTDPGSYIVQSRGVINDAFRAQLKSAGAEVIAYIPNNAFLVRVDAQGADKLAHMSRTRAVLPYEPYYKLQDVLLDAAVKGAPIPTASRLRITFFPGDMQSGRLEVERLGARVLGEDRSPFGPQLIVQPQKDSLAAIAGLSQVQTIERQTQRVAMNDLARVRVGISTNGGTAFNYRGLTGTNVLVSINDSGIDVNYAGLAGRVEAGLNTALTDLRGHGTFVASTLAGSGDPGPTLSGTFMGSASTNNFRGMAPSALLYSQDYRNLSDFELSELPARLNWLTDRAPATTFANAITNTLIANNSWGYDESFEYDSSSAIFDAATRDTIPALPGEQPALFVFSAGNNGFGGDGGLGGLANSVSSLAAAKNVIAVGASETLRFITNEVTIVDSLTGTTNVIAWWEGTTDSSNQVAGYSGRGNTGIGREGQYGRAKPDLMAPGSMLISGRSPSWDEVAYYDTTVVLENTFTNVFLNPGEINTFALYLPDGTTQFTIEVLDTGSGTTPVPNIDVWASQTDANPSSNVGNYLGQAPQTVTITPATTGVWYYELENTGSSAVSVNIRETIQVKNNLGDYPTVLSNNLNGPLAPYYRFEVGTSMAAPVVSGVLALMQEFFARHLNETNNSPALYKAMLINSARTLSQTYGHETKGVINYQGWGLINISNALPLAMTTNTLRTSWPLQYFDQSPTNALATGQSHVRNLTMAATAKPFPLRVSLVWTDPPGNPAASLKLVNDLDLVVSNKNTGEIYYGNDFPSGNIYSVGSVGNTNTAPDIVNNVENVYLPGDLSDSYAIYVVGRRVNVNAVTAHTNGIVQDYALVVSTGNLLLTSPFTLDQSPTLLEDYSPTVRYFTSSTNSLPFFGQRVGANPPLITTTNGTNVQWNFYVFTNNSGHPYVSFVSFLSPNLSGDPRSNTYRDPSADIDLYVSTSPDLTNLTSAVIQDCFANTLYLSPNNGGAVSTSREGTEYVLLENVPAGDQVYYIGIKSEDQKGAEFGLLAVATEDPPFADNGDGTYDINFFPVPAEIPDGTPEKPEGVLLVGIVPQNIDIHRVLPTIEMRHDLYGDLVGTLEHNNISVTLNNHSFLTSTNQGGALTINYDDSDEGDITGSVPTDGPGSLNDFIGRDASGVWMLTMIDNAPQFVGTITNFTLTIEEEEDILDVGSGGISFGLAPGRSYYAGLNIPPGVVQVKFTLGSTPAVFSGLYIKKGGLPNGIAGDYDYSKEATTQFEYTVTVADLPPLTPGRYFLQVMNRDVVYADYNLTAEFVYDLAATVQTTTQQRSVLDILDDARMATNQTEITVNSAGLVAGVRVGVRIAHPRPSDLVLRLSNPDRSVLLAENRGGTVNTNGYGFGTNANEIIMTHFSEGSDATMPIKFENPLVNSNFVPFVTPFPLMTNYLQDVGSPTITIVHGDSSTPSARLIDTGQTDGQIRFRYMFYTAQDSLSLYDSAGNPMPAGNPNPNVLLANEDNEPSLTVNSTDVDVATDTINVNTLGFVDGDEVSFFGGGPVGLSARVRYFVVNATGTSFQLAATAGGTPIDITATSPGTFFLYLWEVSPMYTYTSADGILEIIINESSGVPGTGWDYIIELFDTLGNAVTPPVAGTADQILNGVAFAGTNLYVAGTTGGNGNNGIYARFGLKMQAGQTPFESVNWPDSGGGTHFRDVTYSAGGNVYAVGDSFSGAVDNTGGKETKGVVVQFPNAGLSSSALGSTWNTSIPGVMGVDGLEELHSVISTVEGASPGTEYVYAAGNAETSTSTSRLKVVKLDDLGNTTGDVFEDDTAPGISAGRGIAVLNGDIYVAGFTDDDGTMRPVMFRFDSSLTEVPPRVPLAATGQFHNLIAYDGYLYAVGVRDAVSGSAANFLIVKYDANLNVVWSTVTNAAFDLGDEDILYGVAAAGDRLYAVGSTVSGGAPTDGVILEVELISGNLVTRAGTGYAGVTTYDASVGLAPVNQADSFRDVIMEGTDIYVVGETTRSSGADKDALIMRYHVKDDYLPEESLDNFVGDVAQGVWRLEVIDTRTNNYAGSPVTPRVIDWELQIFLADTNVSTLRLDNDVDFQGKIAGGQVQYFVINAPMTASSAEHTLTITSGAGTGLSLFYDPAAPPNGPTASLLLNGVTTTGVSTLTRTTSPQLVPGQRYFLAVSSGNPGTVVTEYVLNVTFDSSATTFLASSVPKTGGFSDSSSTYNAYQFIIPEAYSYATFELLNLTGDVEVRLKRGSPATATDYDILTSFVGTNYGAITIEPSEAMSSVTGFWYALVSSLSGPDTTYDVRIAPPNNPPFLEAINDVVMQEGETLSLQTFAWDNDAPAQTLSYSLAPGAPYGMTINASGLLQWTPDESQGPAAYAVTVVVRDNGAPAMTASQTFNIAVTEVNSAPTLAAASFTAAEGSVFAPTIQGSDSDLPANTLTYVLVSSPAGMTINPNTGVINWTPDESYGGQTQVFSVSVSDNQDPPLTATRVYQVPVSEVNSAPVFANIAPQTVKEQAALILENIAADPDTPANTLTYSFAGGVPAGMTLDTSTGRISWIPTEAQGPASYTVTVEAKDNGSPSLTAQKAISITVEEVNQAPVLSAIPAQSIVEGEAWTYQLNATDADLPANTLTYSLQSPPSGMSVSSSTGLISWTPSESQGPATYNVTVLVSDNGSPSRAATRTLTVTVTEGNSAPSVEPIADVTLDELTALNVQVVATDSDTPAQALTYKFSGTVATGLVINASSGVISWIPSEEQGPAEYPVTVEVTDGIATTARSFTITVNEANAEPVLDVVPDVTVIEGQAVRFVVTATDADSPAQTLTYSLDAGAPSGATINSSSGAFEWLTSEDSPNSNTLTVRVTDNGSTALSATRTFTITVNEVVTNIVDLVSGTAVTNQTRYTNAVVADIYRLTVNEQPGRILFELFNLTGDGDLLVRRGAHPTLTAFDYSSTMLGTNREQVVVTTNASVTDLSGEWYATIINQENTNITYSISGTIPIEVAGGAMLVSTEGIKVETPVFNAEEPAPTFSWTAVEGEKYQVEVSTDLVNWTPLTDIVVDGATATFTDPTPYNSPALRFYRIRQLPQ